MAALHEWQKIRKAERGWVYKVGKARVVWAWIGDPGSQRLTRRKKIRLARGAVYDIGHRNTKSEWIWLQHEDGIVALKYEDARLSGGVFPDRLRAEVAYQSGAMN